FARCGPTALFEIFVQHRCRKGCASSIWRRSKKPPPRGITAFLTSTSDRALVQSSFSSSSSNYFIRLRGVLPQIVATAFADGRHVLLANNGAFQHPDASCLAVLALHHTQNGFHRVDSML